MRLYAGSRQILFSFSTRRIYFQGIFHHRRSFFCGYGAHVRRLHIGRQCIRPFRSSRINFLPFFQCPFCQFFQKDPIRIFIIDGTPLILQLITDCFHAKLHLLTCSRIKTLKICKILHRTAIPPYFKAYMVSYAGFMRIMLFSRTVFHVILCTAESAVPFRSIVLMMFYLFK